MFVRRFLALGGLTCGLIVGLLASSTANAGWFDIDWWDRNELILDNSASSENLTDFPVLVQLTSSNFDFSRAQANGQDVRFTQSDGTTQLAHEIEHWDQAGQQASVWVKVPTITAGSSTDKIYIYSANATAGDGQNMTGTWNSDFHMVHHLQETSGTHEDSTSYDNDGTWVDPIPAGGVYPAGGPGSQDAVGKIAGCNKFWGIDDYNDPSVTDYHNRIDVSGDASLHGNENITIETWVYQDEAGGWGAEIVRTHGEWLLSYNGSGSQIRVGKVASWGYPDIVWNSDGVALDQWQYIVGTASYDPIEDETILRIFVDGVERNSNETNPASGTLAYAMGQVVRIGARSDLIGKTFLHGLIDEVRYSATTQSPDWIEAQYLSMTDQFVTFGATYTVPEPAGALLLVFGWLFLAIPRNRRRRQSS